MLRLPERGFQRSIEEHNVDRHVLCDWIEGSVLFVDPELSWNDFADALQENHIYREKDFALELLSDALAELKRRENVLGHGAPFSVDGRIIRRTAEWGSVAAHAFCLMLALQTWYSTWARRFGKDYTRQGSMFEELTVECLQALGWTVKPTGWTPGNAQKMAQVIQAVSDHLAESATPGAMQKWAKPDGNEEGLDLVCSRPFADGQGGRPVYFFQCASGGNWEDKLSTPSMEVWAKLVDFTTIPQRGFAFPFVLMSDEFRRCAGRVNGMFLDRMRLLSPSSFEGAAWPSAALSTKLVKWLRPRVSNLPVA